MQSPSPHSTPPDADLLALSREAAHKAYSPYSGFPVGAALLLDDGRVVTGCNVENASYGLGICAERTAVTRMIAEGSGTVPTILAVAITGLKAAPCFPCGACRQVLHEFGCQRVVVEGEDGPESHPFTDILPYAFGPEAL
ncbi:MAG TPA: cytidine deaminase [Candidatus Corynebacterium avicola]|uniref:Cytidine deaminase n=1 Tax=Candidatus Corynebacterium avicola TaxID=2838527 RepID=A0A9D1RMB0_9CORY|nr:cytidine deaminase [Candidatus Corynebacterium avicola]